MKPHRPTHRLETVEIKIVLPTSENGHNASLSADGRSSTRRASLWHYAEGFDATTDAAKGYQLHDAVAHIVLACAQDRPRSLGQLAFALRGGVAWETPELF